MIQIALLDKYFALKTWIVFLFILTIYSVALTIEFRYVFTDNLYFNSFESKRTIQGIENLIMAEREDEWLNYPIAGLVILLPSLLIAFCLNLGIILRDFKVSFIKLFGVVLKAQIIFALNYLISIILRISGIIDFSYYTANNNFEYQSALVFFDTKVLPDWLLYPIQCINITEIIHILFLTLGITWLLNLKSSKALFFVLLWYGVGLLLWIVFSVFLQTNIYN